MKSKVILMLIFVAAILTACGNDAAEAQTAIKQISVEQAKAALEKEENAQLIDVRTAAEFRDGHAPRAINLPLDSLEQNLSKLDQSKPVYLICQTGGRSQKGAEVLEKNGFKDLQNIEGGTAAWKAAGFPVEK